MLGVSQLRRPWGFGQPLSLGWWPEGGIRIVGCIMGRRQRVRIRVATEDAGGISSLSRTLGGPRGQLGGMDRWRDVIIIIAGKVDDLLEGSLCRCHHSILTSVNESLGD